MFSVRYRRSINIIICALVWSKNDHAYIIIDINYNDSVDPTQNDCIPGQTRCCSRPLDPDMPGVDIVEGTCTG